MAARAIGEHQHFGGMALPLETPEDAIALLVEPLGGKHRVGLVHRLVANLFERADQVLESRAALAAGAQVLAVGGEHVGFHQLIVAEMIDVWRRMGLGLRLHASVPPSLSAAFEWRGINALSRSTRSSRSSRPRRAWSDRHNGTRERLIAGGPAASSRRRRAARATP